MNLRMRIGFIAALALLAAGCAHHQLTGADLDRVSSPAFISRIEEGAGPRSTVFRGDDAYAPRLKRLDPKEADRRMSEKLKLAMSRFEIAERLRARTTSLLPQDQPWTHAVDPVRVAAVLQSFLVDEVPANAPDYQLVRDLGADSVVEFVIEEYGVRSEHGKTGTYLLGYGRMFTLDGRELWRRAFKVDQLLSGVGGMDPFQMAKPEHKELWRGAMESMLDAVAAQFAKDLNPADRHARTSQTPSSAGAGTDELQQGSDSVTPQKNGEPAPTTQPSEDDPI